MVMFGEISEVFGMLIRVCRFGSL